MARRICVYLLVVMVSCGLIFLSGCAKKETVVSDNDSAKTKTVTNQQQNSDGAKAVTPADKKQNDQGAKVIATGGPDQQTSNNVKDIYFDFDKYAIRSGDREILGKDASYLLANKKLTVTVEGHCDERGTAEYNMALGERRANETKKYLVNLGVKGDRIQTISYGKEKPVDPGHNEEAWAKNRRAHLLAE